MQHINHLNEIREANTMYQYTCKQMYFYSDIKPKYISLDLISYSTMIASVMIYPLEEKAELVVWEPHKHSKSTTRHATLFFEMLNKTYVANCYREQSFTTERPVFELDYTTVTSIFSHIYTEWANTY